MQFQMKSHPLPFIQKQVSVCAVFHVKILDISFLLALYRVLFKMMEKVYFMKYGFVSVLSLIVSGRKEGNAYKRNSCSELFLHFL